MTQNGIEFRQMRMEDLAFATECTKAGGWVSENLDTLENFSLKDADSCRVAEEDGKRAGICIATDYGRCGFIG